MRTKLRSRLSLLFIALAAMIAIPAVVALGDVLKNTVTTGVGGNVEYIAGSDPISIPYYIQATGGTCDAADGSSAKVTPNVTGTPVKVDPSSQTFTTCDTNKNFSFSTLADATPGVYEITSSVTDTNGTYNASPATFKIDVKAPVSGGGGSQPPANQPPVADAGGPYTVDEGGSVTLAGSGSDPDGTIASYDWDFDGDGQFDDATGATPTFSAANLDGPSNPDPIVALRVTDNGGTTATDTATVHVDNVPPTIQSMTPSATDALSGTANKVTYTGVADDPANADDAAGFTWAWSGGTSTDTDNNSSYQTSFSDCGTKSVSATATDKDNGTSPSRTTSGSELVNVYTANFLSPLKDGTVNKVQKGQVIPVKISIGCNGTNLTGLSPNIQLLNGNQSPETEAGTETLTTSVSSADTGQTMRPVDGGYIYNLAVPKDSTATVGKQYTVRVNPFGATANNAASGMYIVIEIRK